MAKKRKTCHCQLAVAFNRGEGRVCWNGIVHTRRGCYTLASAGPIERAMEARAARVPLDVHRDRVRRLEYAFDAAARLL